MICGAGHKGRFASHQGQVLAAWQEDTRIYPLLYCHLWRELFCSVLPNRTELDVCVQREFPDSARNPRGFAVKFYTEDGT